MAVEKIYESVLGNQSVDRVVTELPPPRSPAADSGRLSSYNLGSVSAVLGPQLPGPPAYGETSTVNMDQVPARCIPDTTLSTKFPTPSL